MQRMRVFDYSTTKKIIKKFNNLVQIKGINKATYKLLSDIMIGTPFRAIELTNEEIYRARWHEKGSLFNHLDNLVAPKPGDIKKKGRFNDIGQSIFYASTSELGTLIELRPEINKFFAISRFKLVTLKPPLFFIVGNDLEKKYPTLERNKTQKLVANFFNVEIIKKAKINDDYNISIMLGNRLLNLKAKIGLHSFNAGIAYSSVEAKEICNRETYNIAMLPSVFPQYYVFEEVIMYVLVLESTCYLLNPINKGILNKNNDIIWTFTLDEMKERTSKGLDLYGKVNKKIIGLEAQL